MSATIIGSVIAGTVPDSTGGCMSSHIVYAVEDQTWWLFYIDDATNNVVHTQFSTDFGVTWQAGADSGVFDSSQIAAPTHNNQGRNFSTFYKAISANDVCWFGLASKGTTKSAMQFARATIASNAITWGGWVSRVGFTTSSPEFPAVAAVCLDANNAPAWFTSFLSGSDGAPNGVRNSGTDSGTSWSAGTYFSNKIENAYASPVHSGVIFDAGDDLSLNAYAWALWSKDTGTDPNSMTNVRWAFSQKASGAWLKDGSFTPGASDIFTAGDGFPLAGASPNDFGAVSAVNLSDLLHCVCRTGTNTYVHRISGPFDWTTNPGAVIPNQTSQAGSGLFMASDGYNVWLFIIDSDANNTVRYIKYTSPANLPYSQPGIPVGVWDAQWSVLEGSPAVRNYISGYPYVVNNQIAVIWSQQNGSNYDIAVEFLQLPDPPAIIGATEAGTISDCSGHGYQRHLIWAVNDQAWWAFTINNTIGTQVRCWRSPTGQTGTWAQKTTSPAFQAGATHAFFGRNISVWYEQIGSRDVVHLICGTHPGANEQVQHTRATISATNISWNANWDNSLNAGVAFVAADMPAAVAVVLDTSNRPFDIGSLNAGAAEADPLAFQATNVDLGTSWTTGFGAGVNLNSSNPNKTNAAVLLDMGSGNVMALFENGAQSEPLSMTNVRWNLWNGSSWSAGAGIFAGLGSGVDPNNFGAVSIPATGTAHCVMRSGANTYLYSVFTVASGVWTTGPAIPTQNSLAAGGIFMATDGSTVWLFVIDVDIPNTIRFTSIVSGGAWTPWAAFETSTRTRSFLSGYPQVVNGQIGVLWTQVNGGQFDLVFEAFQTTQPQLFLGEETWFMDYPVVSW